MPEHTQNLRKKVFKVQDITLVTGSDRHEHAFGVTDS
jgi:hypothetical protein